MKMSAANDELCLGCLQPLPEGATTCPLCGFTAGTPNPAHCLPVRTLLADRYLVGKALEPAGDSLLYLGYDQGLHTAIMIREFYPDTLCGRAPDGSVRVIEGCGSAYAAARESFRQYMRSVARMRELPALIAPYDIFEANHTVYTVTEYVEGPTVEARLKQVGGRLSWEKARPLFMPILTAVATLHAAGIHHLGISTEQLIIGRDGKLHLKGFCMEAARRAGTDLRPQMAAGYAAPEQYAMGGPVGAPADVYALAAVIFRTVTGNPPPDGAARAKDSNDLFVPADVAAKIPEHVAAALFHALQVNPDQRTPSVEQFRDQLAVDPEVAALRAESESKPSVPEPPAKPKNNRLKLALIISASAFVVLLVLAGIVLLLLFPDALGGGGDEQSDPSSISYTVPTTTTRPTTPTQPAYVAPDLMGKNYFEIREESLPGGMTLKLAGMEFSNEPKGTILHQTPNAETGMDEGGEIEIIISAGPEEITVPDVAGWNVRHATLYLEALGFQVNEVRVVSDKVTYDVVEEVENAGEALPLGSTVQLRVSDTVLQTDPIT